MIFGSRAWRDHLLPRVLYTFLDNATKKPVLQEQNGLFAPHRVANPNWGFPPTRHVGQKSVKTNIAFNGVCWLRVMSIAPFYEQDIQVKKGGGAPEVNDH